MGYYRFDIVLSYWIFVWYLLYITKCVKYSPKLALILALIENIFGIFHMLFIKHVSIARFCLNIFTTCCIKVYPLYTLRNVTINYKEDVKLLTVITIVYLLWIYLNDMSVIDLYTSDKTTPLTNIIMDLFKKINS